MKRILLSFLLILSSFMSIIGNSLSCLANEPENTLKESELYAKSAVLMDADSGRILYAKDAQTILPMASTTKIMTCILALENGKLENLVEVSKYASTMPDVQLNIKEGEFYYLKDLLHSLMLESHNDSAVAIAEHIGGTVEGFAEMMNAKAKEIGCEHTTFITPNGLDAEKEITASDGSTQKAVHSTTAEDLARIMSYCIKRSPQKDMFLQITRTPSYTFSNQIKNEQQEVHPGERSFSCNNHNAFLSMMEGALSGKTGFTGDAGYCYVGALERDERTYVVALLACGWPNNKTYKWSDTRKLMEYGLANYQKMDLATCPLQKTWLNAVPVSDAKTKGLFKNASVEVYIKDLQGAPMLLMKPEEKVEVSCDVKQNLSAPVSQNQLVGTIQYKIDGKVYWEREICTKSALEKKDFAWYFEGVVNSFF